MTVTAIRTVQIAPPDIGAPLIESDCQDVAQNAKLEDEVAHHPLPSMEGQKSFSRCPQLIDSKRGGFAIFPLKNGRKQPVGLNQTFTLKHGFLRLSGKVLHKFESATFVLMPFSPAI